MQCLANGSRLKGLECISSSWLFTVFIVKCIRNIYGDGRGLFVDWNLNMCVFLYADYVSLVEKTKLFAANGLHDATCDLN